ncbi:MAG: gliding motility-associated protein GldE [Chitinophagaceae bacterium]|mgnify:FL=1|nr:gliding motility-associated protein GldE [Chitinophagaceae bacterium]MBK8309797.1 gliding motility-associated protein GldE [Chitinophagaceae bacterium]MBK8606620.1 gliding motility-associated protein GldE [Chitinophagaceae bacterium]MBP6476081.1 gliding motility-associated protein GldE [Chitinophagaceae bacterium]MBP7107286.1 gliding motility-associated protein GldE [Chitinophagaceae bacterium]
MVSSLLTFLQTHLLVIDTQSTTFLAITLLVLLVLTFIISGAEVAIFSLTQQDINVLKTKTNSSAKRVINLLEEPKEVYASLMIAGTFVNISIIVLSNFLITQFISFGNAGQAVEILSKVLMIAFVLVFFGKILPKVWATQHNIWFAYGASAVIEPLHLLLRAISKWIVRLADNIGKRAGADKSDAMSMKELDEAIDIKTDAEATLEEKNIMKGIVKFGNITVKQIMRSRLDVSGIDYNLSFGDLIKRVETLHYSRLPVYKGSLDDVVGMIYTKDLIPYLNEADNYDWHPLMRQPFFVPEPKLIEDLLKEFQQKRIHFAVVVDEFGGTSGIATMEDVLEEVIGDIKDEFDEEESNNYKVDDDNYIFEGKIMVHDMCRIMKLPIDTFDKVKGESESLAGLILELAGELPTQDWVIPCGDFEFEIMKVENNRVQLVKVSIKQRTGNENE